MQHYKAPDNSLHAIDPAFAHLLPAGCVPITDEEAEALRPKPVVTVKDHIAAIEAEITPRRLREAVLSDEGAAWLEAKDAEIALLRERL